MNAATTEIRTLIDADNDPSTGCAVASPAGSVPGFEHILVTTIESGERTASVTGVTRQQCAGALFGTPVIVASTGWAAGVDGASGNILVESKIPASAFGGTLPAQMRVAFLMTSGSLSSAVLQSNDGRPILWPPAAGRRRAASPPAGGSGSPRTIILDGLAGDWVGVSPLVSGGASSGSATLRLLSVRAYASSSDLFFAYDAKVDLKAPTAVADTYDVRQGRTLDVLAPGVLANDSNPTGELLAARRTSDPSQGTLVFHDNGGFTYVHGGAPGTSDSFTYRATTPSAESNDATVTLNVIPNIPPTVANDSYSVAHRGTLTLAAPGVLGNDFDADSDPIGAVLQTNPANGTLTFAPNGSFTYTHNGSNTLGDSFTYRAFDGVSSSAPATVAITVGADIPAVAANDGYTVAEGATLSVAAPGVFANDTDPDTPQSNWSAVVVTPPASGTLTLAAGGGFTYSHNGSETTADSFTYRVNDGIALSNIATVAITITPVNDAPAANDDAWSTSEDTPLVIAAPGVLANDTDAESNPLTAAIVTGPARGTVALNANGSFTYTPNANANGTDSFTYRVSDGTATSNSATVTLVITPVNDVPAFTAGPNVTVNEDSGPYAAAWATAITAGPADEASQTLAFLVSNDNNALFAVQPAVAANGTLTFTPAANASGSATVTVRLGDDGGTANGGVDTTAAVTFTITVNAVNDAPSFTKGADQAVLEDAGGLTVNGWATAVSAGPADEAGQTLTFNVSNDNNALFAVQPAVAANGTLTFTPAANASGSATVTVTLADNGGTAGGGVDTSAAQTFVISVTAVNDAPSFTPGANQTVNEDAGAQSVTWATAITAGPSEGSQALAFLVSNDNNALFAVQPAIAANGTLTYTPAANANGSATVTVRLSDDGGTANGGVDTTAPVTFTITVTAVNDPPAFTLGPDQTVAEDSGPATVTPFVTAISPGPADESAQTIASFNVSNDNNALFAVQPAIATNGTLTFTPASNASGQAIVSVTATDSAGATSSPAQTFTITVTPVNDAPVLAAGGSAPAFVEDSPAVVIDNGLTVTDADNATLVSAAVTITNGQSGDVLAATNCAALILTPGTNTLTITGSAALAVYQACLRSVTFANTSDTPNTTARSIDFVVSDGTVSSNTITKTVTVTATNDPPVVTTSAGSSNFTEGGGAIAIDGGIAVTDPDTATIASATVTITNLQNAGLETLAAPVLLGGATASWVAPTLTLTGVTTLANYQTMLAAVTYDNGSASPDTTPRVIAFAVNDGAANSATANRNVTINSVNSAPAVTASGGTTAFVEDGGAVAVDGGLTVTDPDSATLASATVTITNLLDAGAETLAAPVLLGGATAGYVAATGTLTISGVTTVANYQAMLRAVTYDNTSNTPGTTNRSISFRVDDGATANNLSNVAAKTVSVTPMNDAPSVAAGGTLNYTENTAAAAIDATLTVADPDSANLASATVSVTGNFQSGDVLGFVNAFGITGSYNAATGVLTLTGATTVANYQSALRTVTYQSTSENPSTSARTITWTVNDGAANSAAATSTVNVTAVNDAPAVTTSGGTTAFTENAGAVAVDGALTVADVDSASLASATVTITNLLDSGAEVLAAPTLLGSATASYTAPTLTISGAATVAQYQTMLRAVTYTNNSDTPSTTNRTLRFQVNDGAGANNLSNQADKTLSVTAANDAPTVTAGGTLAYTENDAATAIDPAITITDPDSASITGATVSITGNFQSGQDVLSFTNTASISGSYNAATGVLTLTGTDTIANYQSALRAVKYANTSENPSSLARTVTWIANDGTSSSAGATSTINVTNVNDTPALTNPSSVNATEDVQFSFTAANTISVTDADSGSGTNFQATLSAANGTLNVTAGGATVLGNNTGSVTITGTVANVGAALGTVKYTGNANFYGTDTLAVSVNDNGQSGSGGAGSASANITINVAAVNDPPTATAKTHATHSGIGFTIDAATHTGELKEGASDVDDHDPFSELTVQIVSGSLTPSNATLTLISASDGSFYFEPPGGLSGTGAASFQYRVCDNGDAGLGLAAQCSPATTVTINITGPDLWFVDDTDAAACGAGCNGSRTRPLVGLNNAALATRGTGDKIFAFSGTYNHGFTFNASEQLVGQASTGSFDTVLGVSVPGNGTLDVRPSLSGAAVTLQNTVNAASSTTMRGITISSAGNGYVASGVSALTVLESSVSAAGKAVDLTNVSGANNVSFASTSSSAGTHGISLQNVTGTFAFGTGSLANNTTAAFFLKDSNNSTISYGGTLSPGGTGRAVLIGTADGNSGVNSSNGLEAGANVTLSGNITAGGVAVYESSGGTLTLSGASQTWNTGTTRGVELIDNNNTTINFSGGNLNITTSTATGFHASQGGTVNVTGTNNVINTTAGNAFEAIGTSGEHMGGGYAFRSISSANGTRGISVQYHDGAFSVSGDGPDAGTSPDSAIAGGTISGSDVRGAEFIDVDGPISLGGMTFTNPADTAGPDTTLATGTCGSVVSGNNSGCYAGIHIDTAANVTIDTVNVSGSGQMGINGRAINNLTLSTVNVSNSGTSAQEDGIRLFNTTGSGSMTNVSVTNSYSIGLHMANASGTLASSASPFTITNGTFQGSTDAQGALVNAASSGTMYVKFLNGTVSNNFSNGIHSVINTGSTGTLEVTIDGVSLSNNAAAVVMHGQAGALNFDVRNTIHTARSTNSGHSYVIKGDNTGTLNGSLTGNTIGNGTAGSGASCGGACNGINVDARNTSTITVAIRGNTIQNVDFNGIDVFAGQGSARTHATITGNLIRNPDGAFSFAGVFAESGISTSDSSCVTAQIGGLTAWPGAPSTTAAEIQNRIEGAWGTSGIRVRKVGDATAPDPVFNLPLYDGSGVNTWIQNRNSFSGVASPVTNSVGGPAIGGGTSCP